MDVKMDEIGVGSRQGSFMGISGLGARKDYSGEHTPALRATPLHRGDPSPSSRSPLYEEGCPKGGVCRGMRPEKIAVDGGFGGWLFVSFSKDNSLPFTMPIEIKMRKNEPIDRALRRMKKKLERENIIKDVRMKRYNEKPCERRRRKEKVMAFTAMLRRRYAE